MSDIISALRSASRAYEGDPVASVCKRAADEIRELRSRLDSIREICRRESDYIDDMGADLDEIQKLVTDDGGLET